MVLTRAEPAVDPTYLTATDLNLDIGGTDGDSELHDMSFEQSSIKVDCLVV